MSLEYLYVGCLSLYDDCTLEYPVQSRMTVLWRIQSCKITVDDYNDTDLLYHCSVVQ